jgi:predicted enzyme related to lactoylglutathione lyase
VSLSADTGGGIGFEVDDVDAIVSIVRANGTTVKLEPLSSPVSRMALVQNSEGNGVTLHQMTHEW